MHLIYLRPRPRAVLSFCLLTGLVLTLSTQPSADTTTTIDFDPPTFTNGQRLGTINDVTFEGSPIVFVPSGITTFTPPHALRTSLDCESALCTNNANELVMRFVKGINNLSIRVGTESPPTNWCIPEGTTCPTYARLVGYDTNNTAIADSDDILLSDSVKGFAVPVTTTLQISSAWAGIRTAKIFVGKNLRDASHLGNPRRVQIDHLEYSIPDVPPPPPPSPTPPTISLVSPVPNAQFSFPYQIAVRGNVMAPGRLFAFCHVTNGLHTPSSSDCTETNLVDANGNFSYAVKPNELIPNVNTIRFVAYDLAGQLGQAQVPIRVGQAPAPQIVILGPLRQVAEKVDPVTSGIITAPGGLTTFCLQINNAATPSVNECNQKNLRASVDPQGFFRNVALEPGELRLGENTLHAFAYDQWGSLGTASYTFSMPTDLRITAIEITQGIQVRDLPQHLNQTAIYRGVRLVKGRKTVARVFANATATGTYDVVPMRLEGLVQRNGRVLSLGTIQPMNRPQLKAGGADTTWNERGQANSAYIFVLPTSWTQLEPLTVVATLNGSNLYGAIPECTGCDLNNQFTLKNIEFQTPTSIIISPVQIMWTHSSGATRLPPPPGIVMNIVNAVAPLAYFGLEVDPYYKTVDITDLLTNDFCDGTCEDGVLGRVASLEIYDEDAIGYRIGIAGGLDIGLERHVFFPRPFVIMDPVAIVSPFRPLGTVAHEFFHQLAYFHAGGSCPDVTLYVNWPPDDRGVIEGIGMDTRPLSGPTYDTFRILAGGAAGHPAEYFDLMSYCGMESTSWISVQNWEKFGGALPNGALPTDLAIPGRSEAIIVTSGSKRDAQAATDTLHIMAVAKPDGPANIISVRKGLGWIDPVATQSRYHIVVRDQASNIVSDTAVTPAATIRHHDNSVSLSAEVKAKGAAKIEIVRNGAVIARRQRSSGSPQVVMVSPVEGTSNRR